MNGRIVPLHYKLKSGDFVEVLTSKQLGRGPSRDWLLDREVVARAEQDPPVVEPGDTRGHRAAGGRESLEQALKQHNLPYKKIAGSQVLAGVIREMNFKKAEDFYLALGSGKLQVSQVVTKEFMHKLKTAEVAEEERIPAEAEGAQRPRVPDLWDQRAGRMTLVRMAKCCNPVPGDRICGYISLGGRHHHPSRGLPERAVPAGTRSASPRSSGTAGRPRASESRSRSTPGTARGCSRTWRARSPSTARTSSSTPARR